MNNIIVLPLIVPVMTGILLVFLREYVTIQRVISLITVLFVSVVSAVLLPIIKNEGIICLNFSGWAPPFGILFVADEVSLEQLLNNLN